MFAVLCLMGSANALVDYEHAVEHIAKVIQEHQDDFMHDPHIQHHDVDLDWLKHATCRQYEDNHHETQECYTIFELDPCKHYLDDEADYDHCQDLALQKGARKVQDLYAFAPIPLIPHHSHADLNNDYELNMNEQYDNQGGSSPSITDPC